MKKVKETLSIHQVTSNLQRLFDHKEASCTKITQMDVYGTKLDLFYLSFPLCEIVVDSKKQVYIKLTRKNVREYVQDVYDYSLPKIKKVIDGATYVPYCYEATNKNLILTRKHKKANKDKVLLACGLKAEKTGETDIQRLRKLTGRSAFVEIYKLIQEIEVTKAYVGTVNVKVGRYRNDMPKNGMLIVEHTKGRFQFPIFDNITGYEDQDQEIRNIIFNALDLPVTTKQLAEAA